MTLTGRLRRSLSVRREGRENGRGGKNPMLEWVASRDTTVETALVYDEVVQHDVEIQREKSVEKE